MDDVSIDPRRRSLDRSREPARLRAEHVGEQHHSARLCGMSTTIAAWATPARLWIFDASPWIAAARHDV